jgi:hypothetical protein
LFWSSNVLVGSFFGLWNKVDRKKSGYWLKKSSLFLQDITEKVMSFLQIGPRTVVILSAVGAISNVTLRQPTLSGGVARFEVLFLFI